MNTQEEKFKSACERAAREALRAANLGLLNPKFTPQELAAGAIEQELSPLFAEMERKIIHLEGCVKNMNAPIGDLTREIRRANQERDEIAAKTENKFIAELTLERTAREAAEARVKELEEKRGIELAAISVATLENTEKSAQSRLTQDNKYWTPAYKDVCAAVDREIKHRTDLEKAEKACAEMREGLNTWLAVHADTEVSEETLQDARQRIADNGGTIAYIARLTSSTAGQSYIHRSELEAAEREAERAKADRNRIAVQVRSEMLTIIRGKESELERVQKVARELKHRLQFQYDMGNIKGEQVRDDVFEAIQSAKEAGI